MVKTKKQKVNNNIINMRVIFTLLTIIAFYFLNDDKITMMLNDPSTNYMYRVLAGSFFFFLLTVTCLLWVYLD